MVLYAATAHAHAHAHFLSRKTFYLPYESYWLKPSSISYRICSTVEVFVIGVAYNE